MILKALGKNTAKVKSLKDVEYLSDLPDGTIFVDDTLMPIYQKTTDCDNDAAWYDVLSHEIIDDVAHHSRTNYEAIFIYVGAFEKPIEIKIN